MSKKKLIKVKATGLFNRAHNLKWLKEKLNNKFILEYDSPNPDYLIYNVFDEKDLTEKYRNIDAIRIALFTENEYPDMNAADYFVANFHITFIHMILFITNYIILSSKNECFIIFKNNFIQIKF